MDNQTISVLTVLGITVFVIFLLAILFYVPSRQDSDDEYTKISEKSDSENNTYITTEDNHSSSQITIYAFRRKKKKLLCPFCDGENSIDAKVCKICRRDL